MDGINNHVAVPMGSVAQKFGQSIQGFVSDPTPAPQMGLEPSSMVLPTHLQAKLLDSSPGLSLAFTFVVLSLRQGPRDPPVTVLGAGEAAFSTSLIRSHAHPCPCTALSWWKGPRASLPPAASQGRTLGPTSEGEWSRDSSTGQGTQGALYPPGQQCQGLCLTYCPQAVLPPLGSHSLHQCPQVLEASVTIIPWVMQGGKH